MRFLVKEKFLWGKRRSNWNETHFPEKNYDLIRRLLFEESTHRSGTSNTPEILSPCSKQTYFIQIGKQNQLQLRWMEATKGMNSNVTTFCGRYIFKRW